MSRGSLGASQTVLLRPLLTSHQTPQITLQTPIQSHKKPFHPPGPTTPAVVTIKTTLNPQNPLEVKNSKIGG